jgi:CheY-like chemotaxis protein
MGGDDKERILVADDDPICRETLTQWLRTEGYDVVTADTGEEAFLILRDRIHPVDWLYTRAALPGLVDGWILANEYHDTHTSRSVIISAGKARISSQGDIIVTQQNPSRVFKALHLVIDAGLPRQAAPQGAQAPGTTRRAGSASRPRTRHAVGALKRTTQVTVEGWLPIQRQHDHPSR